MPFTNTFTLRKKERKHTLEKAIRIRKNKQIQINVWNNKKKYTGIYKKIENLH